MLVRVVVSALIITQCGLGMAADVPIAARSAIARPAQKFVTSARPIKDRYVVKLTDDAEALGEGIAIADIQRRFPMVVVATWRHALLGFSAEMPIWVAHALSLDPWVDWIEQDHQTEAAGYVQSGASWNLDRVDQASSVLSQTYEYPVRASGVNVYVIDSGIYAAHTDFQGRVALDFTAVNDGYGASDCAGHGTQVASVVGGASYGVAKKVTLHSVRVLECNNQGSVTQMIQGIDWVIANLRKPAVANISAVVSGGSPQVDAAVQRLVDAGVPTAVAAGNGARDACLESPGRVAAAITVGGSSPGDWMYSFSDFGPCVDVFAPGDQVAVATTSGSTSHGVASGTSLASPMVAGAAAMFLAWQPSASPASVAAAITANSTSGALIGLPNGSFNRLLFVNFIPSCGPGLEMCAGACVDTSSDGQSCGACGTTCTGSGIKCLDDDGSWFFAGMMCAKSRCTPRPCPL